MSRGNVELAVGFMEALDQEGIDSPTTRGFFDADVVFEEPPEQPGATVERGLEAVARRFAQFDEAWEEHRSEVEEARVIDSDRVLVLSIERFRGRDGLEFAQPCGSVFTLRDGKFVRVQVFWERRNALAAAGLGE